MRIILPVSLLLMAGCASAPTAAAPKTAQPAIPAVEAVPPKNIGDGSPIVFTHWKGVRRATGTLTLKGKSQRVDAFEAELKPDRTYRLTLPGMAKFSFAGTWAKRDGKTIDIVLDNGAIGTMTFMDRANPSALKLKGDAMSLNLKVSE